MSGIKKYWKSAEELNNDPKYREAVANEFPGELAIEDIFSDTLVGKSTKRRDFLKAFGFSITAAAVAAGCEIPVQKAIPYVIKPDEITPGVANWYASTFAQGGDYCSIMVKTREGRPIKIEGNELSSITQGATSARVQASVLSLYDMGRVNGPIMKKEATTWGQIDSKVATQLAGIKGKNGNIRILSSTIVSPSMKQAINDFISYYPSTKHITCDAISYSGMLTANERSFNKRIIPTYRFDKANVIVSFDADFLGTWISPIEYTKQYTSSRDVSGNGKKMSKHTHFEAGMSLTGTNADVRFPVNTSQANGVLLHLYNSIAELSGNTKINGLPELGINKEIIKGLVDDLWKNKGKALVISGSNSPDIQMIVNGLNNNLGNYGNTIELNCASYQKQGDDPSYMELMDEMEQGAVDAILLYDVNPVYNLPNGNSFKDLLSKVGLSISFSGRNDETSSHCTMICPDHHYLEAWSDAQPKDGHFSLGQPTIRTLFETRPVVESLLTWSGNKSDAYTYIKNYWENNLFSRQQKYSNFQNFWDHSLHNGVFEFPLENNRPVDFAGDVQLAASRITSGEGIELLLYENVGLGNGEYANNPWLQEMPDPVTKITWDNHASVSRKFATKRGLKDGDVINIASADNSAKMKLPVLIQPGQANDTISVALGYGRVKSGKAGDGVGQNGSTFITADEGGFNYSSYGVGVSAAGTTHELACTQWHHNVNIETRPIVRETTLAEYNKDPQAGNKFQPAEHKGFVSLFKKRDYKGTGHHWAMGVDLNGCTGCGNCIVSCQAENNIPVVGREEVIRRHEMHWMRIDRYYTTTENETVADPEENPAVIHQPMPCQHCDQAPCENVCPVAATSHSAEGLNQMAYNRCVGTRYCANNCPYKVRRFNWFDYTGADTFPWNEYIEEGAMANDLTRMVLNPDVTVRSRGVMEKCTFCVQRIQEGKLTAKKEGRNLNDSDIQTACQQSCPGNAIVFGDVNDPDSRISQFYKDERKFHVLEEIHTLPSIGYLTKVRNKEP